MGVDGLPGLEGGVGVEEEGSGECGAKGEGGEGDFCMQGHEDSLEATPEVGV